MNGPAYYNELDGYAASWLRNLIAAGLIAPGDVDERSIVDVSPDDLAGYRQCHFFAGIGGWSYALRLAGWPDDRSVWTGSCPCQPLSRAGQRKGHADQRHLWPAFYRLIAECRPATVFGEQVAGALGREWLAGVRADLEGAGYAIGAADLCAASRGAPHIRQRLFWLADAGRLGDERRGRSAGASGADRSNQGDRDQRQRCRPDAGDRGSSLWLADTEATGHHWRADPGTTSCAQRAGAGERHKSAGREQSSGKGEARGLGHADENGCGAPRRGVADTEECDPQPYGRLGDAGTPRLPSPEREDLCGEGRRGQGRAASEPSTPSDFWSDSEFIACLDGKTRRTGPGIFPLAHGVSARVGKLRASGNAIVPEIAAEFIAAWMSLAP